MSKNTKLYSYLNTGAPRLYNTSAWGDLIKVIRYAVNGGSWSTSDVTKITYDPSKQYIRVMIDNSARTYVAYQTIEFNTNCGVFSGKEAIIRFASTTYLDITLHDNVPELSTNIVEVTTVGMKIRFAKLGFTEAYTDNNCGVFKAENHNFYFCLNDNNPSNASHTYLTNNTMMPRPTVYMCEGMDGIHNFAGDVFPYDATYPTAYIGGNAFQYTNSTYWQNGLFGWDYQFANAATNSAFTEIKWWIIGNGDNINLIMENPNAHGTSTATAGHRCFFFQVVHNGIEYTPIMNGYWGSQFKHYYDKNLSLTTMSDSYHYLSFTFGYLPTSANSVFENNKLFKPTNLYNNVVILKNPVTKTSSSVYLYPSAYVALPVSGNSGDDYATKNRYVAKYNICPNKDFTPFGTINMIKFICNSNVSNELYNGQVSKFVDVSNKEHLYFAFRDYFQRPDSATAVSNASSGYYNYYTRFLSTLYIDLLGKFNE